MTDDALDRCSPQPAPSAHPHCSPLCAAPAACVQPAADKLKIGVIGAGNIGGTIGGRVKAGHPVMFSSRHPEELKPLTDRLESLANAGNGRGGAGVWGRDPPQGAVQGGAAPPRTTRRNSPARWCWSRQCGRSATARIC